MANDQVIRTMQDDIGTAQQTADGAVNSISTHEKICALRYENIQYQMQAIPKIYETLGKLYRLVYMGVGIFIGLPVIVAGCYGLYLFVEGMHK